MNRKLLLVISALALVGIILSVVSIKNHYSGVPTEYCDLGETFNCDLVNRSVYSRFLGVPVAIIGLVGYAALFILSRLRGRGVAPAILVAALGGLVFSLYLTYIEAYVLGVWCILCLSSLATIAAITVLAAIATVKTVARLNAARGFERS